MYNFAEGYTNESLARELDTLRSQFVAEDALCRKGAVLLCPASSNGAYHKALDAAAQFLRNKDKVRSAAEQLVDAELFRRNDYADGSREILRLNLAKALYGENDQRIRELIPKYFKVGEWVVSKGMIKSIFVILKIDRQPYNNMIADRIYYYSLDEKIETINSRMLRKATPEEIKKAQEE